jgi:hypothetical protein
MNVNDLADLAQQVEITDPIEWGYLRVDETTAYRLMASSVIQIINNIENDQKLDVAMAAMTKLLVENFILNLKLETQK